MQAAVTNTPGTCVTIGVFDGLHLGHRALINRCVREAKSYGLAPLVLSFQNHPLSVLAPPYCPKRIMRPLRKAAVLADLECVHYVNLPFTREFAQIGPVDFCHEILHKACNAKFVIVGYDFTFGSHGEGNMQLLKAKGHELGFEVMELNPVACGDLRVKSTMVRETLHTGQVDVAAWMLGRPHELFGKVVTGFGRGRQLGFPTANLELDTQYAVPARGVYAVRVHIEGDWRHYGGMLNIGMNPTFNNTKQSVEVHLISFDGDLVGKNLEIDFITRLRDEMKFSSPEALAEQLRLDELAAREALGHTKEY